MTIKKNIMLHIVQNYDAFSSCIDHCTRHIIRNDIMLHLAAVVSGFMRFESEFKEHPTHVNLLAKSQGRTSSPGPFVIWGWRRKVFYCLRPNMTKGAGDEAAQGSYF